MHQGGYIAVEAEPDGATGPARIGSRELVPGWCCPRNDVAQAATSDVWANKASVYRVEWLMTSPRQIDQGKKGGGPHGLQSQPGLTRLVTCNTETPQCNSPTNLFGGN